MEESIYDLNNVAGDTPLRYEDMKKYVKQPVYVRLTTQSTNANIYYKMKYLETPIVGDLMDAMNLE